MRYTTLELLYKGRGFTRSFIDPKIVESYLSKSIDDYVVFEYDGKEYMAFAEQHPMFNVATLLKGNGQIYTSGIDTRVYYAIRDIIEILYQKAINA